MKIAGRLHF